MAGKSPASHHSISSGKTAPTLTPTGKFAGKPEVPLSRTVTLVGSGAGARLQLISSTVSKSHALLVNCDRGFYVRDLASRTKVIVNGSEVREAVLHQGDRLQLGKFAFNVNEPPGRDDEARERTDPPPAAQIEIAGVDNPIPLSERCLLIGRRDTCDVVITDDSVSTAHAVIFEMDGRRFVRDLGSRTGTFVNGTQVHQSELELGDTVRIGAVDLKYVAGEAELAHDLFESQDLNDLVATQELDEAAAAVAAAGTVAAAEDDLAVEEVPLEDDLLAEPARATGAADDGAIPLEPLEPLPTDEIEVEAEPQEAAPEEAAVEEQRAAAPAPAHAEVNLDDLALDHLDDLDVTPLDPDAVADDLLTETAPPLPLRSPQPSAPAAPAEEEMLLADVEDVEVDPELAAALPVEEPLEMEEPLGADAPPPAQTSAEADDDLPAIEEAPQEVARLTPPAAPFMGFAGDIEFAPPVNLSAPAPARAPAPINEQPIVDPEPLAIDDDEPAATPAALEDDDLLGLAEPSEDRSQAEDLTPLDVAIEDDGRIDAASPAEFAIDNTKLAQAEEELSDDQPATSLHIEEDAATGEVALAPTASSNQAGGSQSLSEAAELQPALDEPLVDDEPISIAPVAEENLTDEPVAADESLPIEEPLAVADEPIADTLPIAEEPVADVAATADALPIEEDQGTEEAAAFSAPTEATIDAPPLDMEAFEAEADEQAQELSFDVPDLDDAPADADAADVPAALEEVAITREPTDALSFSAPSEVAPLDFGEVTGEAASVAAGDEPSLTLDLGVEDNLPPIGTDAIDDDALKLDLGPDFIAPPVVPPAPAVAAAVELATPEIPQRPVARRTPPAPARPAPAPVAPPRAPEPVVQTPPPAPAPEPVINQDALRHAPQIQAEPEPQPEELPVAAIPQPVNEPIEEPTDEVAGNVEVIEYAEATPSSALEVGEEFADIDIAPESSAPIEQVADLTDTRFGRAVDEFTHDTTTGPLVEDPAPIPVDASDSESEEPFNIALERDLGLRNDEPSLDDEPSLADDNGHAPAAASPDDSMADLLAQDEKTEEEAAADPLAGFASFNTLARSLDLQEPVEGLPGLEPGAEQKFSTLSEPELSPLDDVTPPVQPHAQIETSSLDNEATANLSEPAEVALDDFDIDEALATPAPEPTAEIPPAPVAPAAPIATTPPPAPQARQAPPPAQRPPAPDPMNWGANQEHFLGGMPLRLGDVGTQPSPPPLVARPAPQPNHPKPAEQPAARQAPPAAPAAPPAPRQPQAPAPARPTAGPTPPRQRPTPKPRTPNSGGMGLVSGPAQQQAPKQVTTGFDGLAMGSARQVDVFSQMPMNPTGDPFGGGGNTDVFGRKNAAGPGAGAPAQNRPNPGARRTPAAPAARPAQGAGSAGESWAAAAPPAAEPTEVAVEGAVPPPAPPKKKRRWFGLKSLLILMMLAMGATAAGVWYGLPDQAVATGSLKFTNFGKLTQMEKRSLDRRQQELLASEQVRKEARAILLASGKKVEPGFLDKPAEFGKAVSGSKLDFESGWFTVSYVGSDPQSDKPRMRALLTAMYNGNREMKSQAAGLRDEVARLAVQSKHKQKELDERKAELERYRQAAESRPDAGELTRLQSDASRLETEFHDSVVAVAKLSSEIEKLQSQSATTQPTMGTIASAPMTDTELARYESDFQKLQERIATVKDMRTKKAAQARGALDSAMEAFQKQIEQAQNAVKGNNDLASYFSSAQSLQTRMKELTDRFLASQEGQYGRLNELKARMDEKMAARRDDAMKNDPKMKDYLEKKAIKSRQYNAALAQGYTKEAEEYKADLSLLEQMIKARQTQIGDDQFYADAIEQLQKIIDATQKGIQDDRKVTEKMLEQMRLDFAKSQPQKEKLTDDQKTLAAQLEKRLASVEEARKNYTEAAELANAQADEEIRQMEANVSTLSDRISSRKRQAQAERDKNYAMLTARERQASLVQKQQELARAQSVKASTEQAYSAAKQKFVDVQNRMNQAREAGAKRDDLTRVWDQANREFTQITDQLEQKRKLAEAWSEPMEPTDANVQVVTQKTQRPMYMMAGLGGVAALFACLMVISAAMAPAPVMPPPFAEPGAGYGDEQLEYVDEQGGYETMEENAAYADSSSQYDASQYEGEPSSAEYWPDEAEGGERGPAVA